MKLRIFASALAGLMLATGCAIVSEAPHKSAEEVQMDNLEQESLAVAEQMVEAWNNIDAEGIVNMFAEDGFLHSMMREPVVGHDNLRANMTALLDGVTMMNLNLRTVAVKGNVVYLERVDEFAIGDLKGSVPAFGVLVIENGKVAEWREYFDREELLIEMGAIPKPGTHINFVRALIAEWQAGNIEAVLDRLNDDIVFHYRVGVPPARGKAEVREFLVGFKARISDIDWRITNFVEGPNRLMVEGSDSFTDQDGVPSTVPYAGIFEFKDGKISGWRDYFNPAVIEQSRSPEGLPDYLADLVSKD